MVAVDPSFVVTQIEAVISDMAPAAVKTGMLAGPQTVAAVAELASRGDLTNLVVDPVLVSTSGHALMEEGGVVAYRRLLLPHAANLALGAAPLAAVICSQGIRPRGARGCLRLELGIRPRPHRPPRLDL